MCKKHLLVLIFSMLMVGIGHAQNMSVSSFVIDEKDLSANIAGTMVFDQNGEKCALIRIQTTQNDFSFDVGTLGVMKVEYKTAEVWVYVPFGARKITIRHPQLGSVTYDFPIPIEKAKTYIMKLITGEVQVIVKQTLQKQNLIFEVSPTDAVLFVNDELWPLDMLGKTSKLCDFGNYSYRVEAPMYHSQSGVFTLTKTSNVVKVDLKPNFAFLVVEPSSSELNGAKVYVDNKYVGTLPYKSGRMEVGNHTIVVTKELYKQYNYSFILNNGQTLTLNADLKTNFKYVTLKAIDGSEIWVNGKFYARDSWSGKLEYGTYQVECKKDNHHSSSEILNISPSSNSAINLRHPIPIMGMLNITSYPSGADVYADGVLVGKTPLLLDNILSGHHELVLRAKGFIDTKVDVDVARNNLSEINVKLDIYATKAEQLYRSAAERGDAIAQYELGICYYYGIEGLSKSYSRAVSWFKKAAYSENADALNLLRKMASNGQAITMSEYNRIVKSIEEAILEAYNTKYKNKGLTHQLDLSYAYQIGQGKTCYTNLGFREYGDLSPVMATYTMSYRLNHFSSIGVGAGVKYDLKTLCIIGETFIDKYENSYTYSQLDIPVFVNMKLYLLKKSLQPYLSLSAGYYLFNKVPMVDASLGMSIRTGRTTSLNISAGAKITPWPIFSDTSSSVGYTPSVGVNVGFGF